MDKDSGSNLAQVQVNKGQPAPAQAAPHHMNNGSRPAPPAPPTAHAAPPAADVQKLQQQLQDIKEQVTHIPSYLCICLSHAKLGVNSAMSKTRFYTNTPFRRKNCFVVTYLVDWVGYKSKNISASSPNLCIFNKVVFNKLTGHLLDYPSRDGDGKWVF